MAQKTYKSNAGATITGIRDLRSKTDPPYDRLLDEDRLDGKTILLTGSTSGLGLAVARDMARRGGRVLMVARRNAAEELESVRAAGEGQGGTAELLQADMARFESIRKLTDGLSSRGEQLDVVVSNAAVVPSSCRVTQDGLEEMVQVNALSPALLITQILKKDLLRKAPDAPAPRIVVVASEAHRSATALDLDRLTKTEDYSMAESTFRYGWTKLLLLAWTLELARRLEKEGIAVHALCPGPIASNIAREAPRIAQPLARLFFRIFFQSPEKAAEPVVFLASSRRIEGGNGSYQFLLRKREPTDLASHPDSGRAVWEAFQGILQ